MVELGDFLVEVELLDDIHHILRKMVQVTAEVVGNVVGIGQQTLEGKGRYIIEVIAGSCSQETFPYSQPSLLTKFISLQYSFLGRGQRI